MHPWQKRWRQGETTLTFFRVPQQMAHRVSARTDPSFTDILAEISRGVGGLNCGRKTGEEKNSANADECERSTACFCGTDIQLEQESVW